MAEEPGVVEQPPQEQEEIEVNFRLDGEGRTAPTTAGTTTETSDDDPSHHRGPPPAAVDYRSQTVQTSICYCNDDDDDDKSRILIDSQTEEQAVLDELLLDCEMADSALMPRTFWMPAHGRRQPACTLEQFALDVFHHHVRKKTTTTTTTVENYDPETSGAEWWVQIRPSPPAGRYAVLHAGADDDDDISKQGIWFHWDKDEDLRQLMGDDTTYIHPHLSTVTYLSSHGAPTLTVNRRIHPLTGKWIQPNDGDDNDDAGQQDQAFISWPRRGKHLSFDGRFLHAAPPELLPEHARLTDPALSAATADPDRRRRIRRQRRVTFLVNIWLNYKPLNVHPFPMVEKMSGSHAQSSSKTRTKRRCCLSFGPRSEDVVSSYHAASDWQAVQWPMGGDDSGETIHLTLPLDRIRDKHKQNTQRDDVSLTWPVGGIRLERSNPAKKRRKGEGTIQDTTV